MPAGALTWNVEKKFVRVVISRVVAVIAVLSTSLVAAQGVSAAVPADKVSVYVAERKVATAPSVQVDARFSWGAHGGYAGYVATVGSGSSMESFGGFGVDVLPDDGPYARAQGATYGCPDSSPCSLSTLTHSPGGASLFQVAFPQGTPQPNSIYLVVRGHDIDVSLNGSPGWALRRSSLRARFISADADRGTVAVAAAANRVERFQRASVKTTSQRSLALGTPPCRNAHRVGFVREGRGSVTLTGGRRAAAFDCSETGAADPAGVAAHPTSWTLLGDITGVATGPTRLMVIEL